MPTAPKQFRLFPPAKRQINEQHWQSRNTEHRSWYNSPQWRKLRESIFRRDCGLCQECLRNGDVTALKLHNKQGQLTAHVDHIKPHNGDRDKFDDPTNLETLCATCHGRKTAKHDGGYGHGKQHT